MDESEVIERLRRIATDPAARGLLDDAAVLDGLVITHDSIAEGVHFLPFDPPASVGWKLVAVNLSDLAAKGATARGRAARLTLGDATGIRRSSTASKRLRELRPAADRRRHHRAAGAPRVLGLTAIGAPGPAPSRAGGRPGDRLWLSGTIGDAGAASISCYRLRRRRRALRHRHQPPGAAPAPLGRQPAHDRSRAAIQEGAAAYLRRASTPRSPSSASSSPRWSILVSSARARAPSAS
jgi:thiamine monophosphate kinase